MSDITWGASGPPWENVEGPWTDSELISELETEKLKLYDSFYELENSHNQFKKAAQDFDEASPMMVANQLREKFKTLEQAYHGLDQSRAEYTWNFSVVEEYARELLRRAEEAE